MNLPQADSKVINKPIEPLIDLEQLQSDQLAQAEQMVEAVNHSSSIARGLYLAFLSFTAFLFVITSTTDDIDLLLRKSIQLPFFGVGVDLEAFYRFAPWLYCLSHINMLMVLALLSKKLSVFHSKLSHQPYEIRELLRTRLHVFAPIQYLSNQHDGVLKLALWAISRVMLVWLPPATILWLQIDSLALQEEGIVWFQRIALVVNVVFTYSLWTRMLQGGTRSIADVSLPGSKRTNSQKDQKQKISTIFVLTLILVISFLGAMIPLGSWEQRVSSVFNLGTERKCDPSDPLVIRNYPNSCSNPISKYFFDGAYSKQDNTQAIKSYSDGFCGGDIKKNIGIISGCWFLGRRHLHVAFSDEENRIKNIVGPRTDSNFDLYKTLKDPREWINLRRDRAALYLDGISLKFINFYNMNLPWTKLDFSDLRGANMRFAVLEGSSIEQADLTGASIDHANFTAVNLYSSNIPGVSMNQTQLDFSLVDTHQLNQIDWEKPIYKKVNVSASVGGELYGWDKKLFPKMNLAFTAIDGVSDSNRFKIYGSCITNTDKKDLINNKINFDMMFSRDCSQEDVETDIYRFTTNKAVHEKFSHFEKAVAEKVTHFCNSPDSKPSIELDKLSFKSLLVMKLLANEKSCLDGFIEKKPDLNKINPNELANDIHSICRAFESRKDISSDVCDAEDKESFIEMMEEKIQKLIDDH